METSKPFQSFSAFSKRTRYLPGRYLVRLKHKDQTPICRKYSRPGHQTGTWPDTFCFNCEELERMTDSCPEEIHCCIFRVTGHMAADCSYSDMESPFFSFTIWQLWYASATTFLVAGLSNPLSLLMCYLPHSFRSLSNSQRNLPRRLLSIVNIWILLSIFLTFRIFWWEFSSSVFTAVFAAFWSTITQFLEFL